MADLGAVTPEDDLPAPYLSVVVPAYREAETIGEALRRLIKALDDIGRTYEVIVVSDGNTDGTEDRAMELGHEHLIVVHYEPNRGKGFAIKHGAGLARGEVVVFIDADLDIHPDSIAPMLDLLERTPADAVVASKLHPDSNVSYPRFRRVQSSVLRLLIRTLFDLGVSDTQTGLKVFRAPLLVACLPHVTSEGFAYDLELLVLANDHDFAVIEGPLELDYKFSSTTGTTAVIGVLRDLFALRQRRRVGMKAGTWLT